MICIGFVIESGIHRESGMPFSLCLILLYGTPIFTVFNLFNKSLVLFFVILGPYMFCYLASALFVQNAYKAFF